MGGAHGRKSRIHNLQSRKMAGTKPFCELVSAPAADSTLVGVQDSPPSSPYRPNEAMESSAASEQVDREGRCRPSGAAASASEVEEEDGGSEPSSPLLRMPSTSEEDAGQRSDSNEEYNPHSPRTRRRKLKKCACAVACLLIGVILLASASLCVFGALSVDALRIGSTCDNTNLLGEYTRTGIYVFLANFTLLRSVPQCDVLGVDTSGRPETSEEGEVNVFLTECGNIIYKPFYTSLGHFTQVRLNQANHPIAVLNEDNLRQDQSFEGNLTIIFHAEPDSGSCDGGLCSSEVHICHFSDPKTFKGFLKAANKWKDFTNDMTKVVWCEIVTLTGNETGSTNYSVTFTISQTCLSFVGAVQTQNHYTIQFGYDVSGKKIDSLRPSNNTQSCVLNAQNGESNNVKCTLNVNHDLIQSGNESVDLCLVGRGISAGDGAYRYAHIDVEFKRNSINGLIVKVAALPVGVIMAVILLVVVLNIIICVRINKRRRVSTSIEVATRGATSNLQELHRPSSSRSVSASPRRDS